MVAFSLVAGCDNTSGETETVHERQDEPDGMVRVSEAGLARSGIRTTPLRRELLVGGVDIPAEVRLNPNRTAHISPMVSGQIAEVEVMLGDSVKAGQTLATMRSVALGEARSAVANSRAAVEVARANFVRQEELKREGIGSQRAFLEAQGELRSAESNVAAANERLHVYGGRRGAGSTTVIRSPLDGIVIERHATSGEVVSEGSSLFMVSDLSRVWVVGRVYEQDVAAARVGAPATITLQAYPGRTWRGNVSYVGHTLDPHTRTLDVRIELDNSEGILRPGLFGTVSLTPEGDAVEPVLVVPQSAVQRMDGQSFVFVGTGEPGEFRAVFVTLGTRAHGQVEVREGLTEGDEIVVSGAFTLKSELLRGRLSQGEHGH